MLSIQEMGLHAKEASRVLATASTLQKNKALGAIAQALPAHATHILKQNALDMQKARENGMSEAMLDRLLLTEARINSMAQAVFKLMDLDDPIGTVLSGGIRPNGLRITKVRVPLGVAGIIYESRPNVTVDAATLCLKSGNAVILRGGKEAFHSCKCLADLMREAVQDTGLPSDIIQYVEDVTRESTAELMKCNRYVDVLIPRGGAGLIQAVLQNATVPVIETGVGNCHVYVDETADLDMAVKITDNAKTSRPSVCNAIENLLVHRSVAEVFLPMVKAALDAHHVELRGCEETRRILGESVKPAAEEDYATEFLDYILAVKVVGSVDEAISHIAKYTSFHSECIVTGSLVNAEKFQREVDAAAVYVNASTRFTDGGEFGMGAEIGISTQKLHARGPMGLIELTSVKYLVNGDGQIR